MGLRPERPDQARPPRDHYENLIAPHYADQGYVKFAFSRPAKSALPAA